jgi:hypothetical protein
LRWGPARAAREAGPLRATILIVVLVHAAGTFAYVTLWRTLFAPDFDVNDFKAYYAGAAALAEGRRDLLYPDPATLNLGVLPDQPWVRFAVERGVPTPSGYIYPPFLAVVLRPLTALPYHRANQAWFALNVALFGAGVALLASWRPGGLPFEAACGVLFACLCFYPTFRAFQCGQASLLVLFLLAGGLWAFARGRDAAAGALVAVAAAVKITPAILVIFFLAARRLRAAAWAAAAFAATLAISVAGAGWANHVTFAADIAPVLARGAATFANQSLAGALDRIALRVTMNAFELVDEPGWLKAATRGLAAVLLLASILAARRLALAGRGAAGFSLVVLASLLASPISWEHHFVAALLPIAVLVGGEAREGTISRRRAALLAAAYVLLASNAYDLIRHRFPYWAGRIAVSYACAGACVLWALIAAGAAGPGRGAGPDRGARPAPAPSRAAA